LRGFAPAPRHFRIDAPYGLANWVAVAVKKTFSAAKRFVQLFGRAGVTVKLAQNLGRRG
jgi:hypothetical protein